MPVEARPLVMLGAMIATFALVFAVGQWGLMRYVMWRRARRFLDVAPLRGQPADGESAFAAAWDSRLATFATEHTNSLLLILLAVALVLAGGVTGDRLVGILLAISTVVIAVVMEQREAARHHDLLTEQLPGALRLMAAALDSGYSVQLALERVANGSAEPIASEFARHSRRRARAAAARGAIGDGGAERGRALRVSGHHHCRAAPRRRQPLRPADHPR